MRGQDVRRVVELMMGPLVLAKLVTIAAFSVSPVAATHQLSNVEKRHHELGAQRNELFSEMQDLLKQQRDEVAACRADLVRCESSEGSQHAVSDVCAGTTGDADRTPSPASVGSSRGAHERRGQIATIAGVERSKRRANEDRGDLADERMDDAYAADFANYFYSYAELDHQKQMLEDESRMEAYRNSMLLNKDAFEGRTVLDVGSGSGVLAIFAAQAGAKKVYAVEYTDMAKHARALVEANGFSNVIEVIQGSAESLELPEKVDIIVSEFMGYFLLRESMLDSVIVARDKWLKDTGLMFPSHATMVWAAVDDRDEKARKDSDHESALSSWSAFADRSMRKYGVNMTALDQAYEQECVEFYSLNSLWRELGGDQVVSEAIVIKELDLHTCTLEDTQGLSTTPFSFFLRAGGPPLTGFAGWFDVSFRGRDDVYSLSNPVELSTAPAAGYTHWGQQVFYLQEPVEATEALTVSGTLSMVRQADNPRLYNVKVEYKIAADQDEASAPTTSNIYKLS